MQRLFSKDVEYVLLTKTKTVICNPNFDNEKNWHNRT